jgi:ribonuclease P protein component
VTAGGARERARLRRADRLRDGRDFRRVSREGRRRSSRHFVALVAPGRDPERARLGLTVSRRVGGAVGRNRVKRRVREWFRRRREVVGVGVDVVVIARRGAAEQESCAIARELEAMFR